MLIQRVIHKIPNIFELDYINLTKELVWKSVKFILHKIKLDIFLV